MAAKPKTHERISKINFTDANRPKGKIEYLVKHYVGAAGGAEANCNFFYDTYRGASAHYFVGHNGEIWQCVRENDIAWHCGASSYKHPSCRNSNSIGVELCVKKDKNGEWYYTEKTRKAAVKLFAYLMDKYEIDASHVLRHYDVTGKVCGEPDVRTGNMEWKEFKKAVAPYGKGAVAASGTAGAAKNSSFYVETKVDSLFVRKNPQKKSKEIGYINEKAGAKKKYKVTKVKDGWGYVPKKGGWIALAYTKKVNK